MRITAKEKNIRFTRVIAGILIVAGIWVIFIGMLIYTFRMNNAVTRATAGIFPYPAAMWGTDVVTVGKLETELIAAKKFYESQDFSTLGMRVDFNTDQGKKRLEIKEKNILNKLIESRIIEDEAKKRGITISDKEVSDNVNAEMQKYGSEGTVKDDMKRLYGWDLADFEENIVKPDLYKQRLSEDMRRNDEENKQAKTKIEAALAELNQGKKFEDVVKKYSEGESAGNGGDLGWFGPFQMLPEISNAVFLLNKGDRSGVIESDLGFHIVQVDDKNTEDGQDKVKLRQVFVRAKTLPVWLTEKEKNMRIHVLLRDFYWNSEVGSLDFKSKDMQDFENNLDRNSPDDISVLF